MSDTKGSFKRALLNCVQTYWEENITPPKEVLELGQDKSEEAFGKLLKYKTSLKGNTKFIGELMSTGVLAIKVLRPIFMTLMEQTTP